MALARIISAICRDRANVLVVGNLVQQLWMHGGITVPPIRHLESPNLQRVDIDPGVDLVLQTALWLAVLSCVPFTFPNGIDLALSISKCSGPGGPRKKMSAANAFRRRH